MTYDRPGMERETLHATPDNSDRVPVNVDECLKALQWLLLLWLFVRKLNRLSVQIVDVAHVSKEKVFWISCLILSVAQPEV